MFLVYWIVEILPAGGIQGPGKNLIQMEGGTHPTFIPSQPERIHYTQDELHALRELSHDHGRGNTSRKLTSDTIKTIKQLGINRKRVRIQDMSKAPPRGVNYNNLIVIKTVDDKGTFIDSNIKLSTLNVRSLKNKSAIVYQELMDNNIDLAVITETWLKDTDSDIDWCKTCEFNNDTFCFKPLNRTSSKGGGIALITRTAFKVTELKLVTNCINCEIGVWKIQINKTILVLVGIYRPPSSHIKSFTSEMIDVLSELLQVEMHQLILTGDFNIHIHDITSADVIEFNTTMDTLGLTQHIMGPTHNKGNTLDLMFTNDSSTKARVTS